MKDTEQNVTWRAVAKAIVLTPLAILLAYCWPAGLFLSLMWLSGYCHGR